MTTPSSKWFKLTTVLTEIPSPPPNIAEGTLPDGSVIVQAVSESEALTEFKTTDLSSPITPVYAVVIDITKGTMSLMVPATTPQAATIAATTMFSSELSNKITGVEYSLRTPVRVY